MKTTSIKVITNKINLIYVYVEIIEMYENTQNEEKNHILVLCHRGYCHCQHKLHQPD